MMSQGTHRSVRSRSCYFSSSTDDIKSSEWGSKAPPGAKISRGCKKPRQRRSEAHHTPSLSEFVAKPGGRGPPRKWLRIRIQFLLMWLLDKGYLEWYGLKAPHLWKADWQELLHQRQVLRLAAMAFQFAPAPYYWANFTEESIRKCIEDILMDYESPLEALFALGVLDARGDKDPELRRAVQLTIASVTASPVAIRVRG